MIYGAVPGESWRSGAEIRSMTKTKRVLIALSVNNDYHKTALLQGLQSYLLMHRDLRAHFCLLDTEVQPDIRKVRRIVAQFQPDGILASVFWKPGELRLDPEIPIVSISDIVAPSYPTVIPDQERDGQMVAEHLLSQGLNHFAFIGNSANTYDNRMRLRGFAGALRARGHTVSLFDGFDRSSGVNPVDDDALAAWLTGLPRPVGIHAAILLYALRVVWACREQGLLVPNDVAVVGGHDNPPIATAWPSPVSAIEIDIARIGSEGLKLLDDLMRGRQPPQTLRLIAPARIVQRQSSDVRGRQDPEVARIRQLIGERAHEPLVVKELLSHVKISRRALERRFEKQLGHTLHDEIVQAHMERAMQLLKRTLLPIRLVAEQSGYSSYAVFSVAFRQHTGMSAMEYRRQNMSVGGG